uniref:ANK_REP_REGION domain-containing protein n=1 Tax=Mesocestoides corti TaxID=53468 RepID=A0A5K3FDW7_MESCO
MCTPTDALSGVQSNSSTMSRHSRAQRPMLECKPITQGSATAPCASADTESFDLTRALFRIVRKGRVSRLQSYVAKSLATDHVVGPSLVSNSAATVYLLASTVDSQGRRLLHVACEYGQVKMLRYLVSIGLPIEVYDKKGNTPVHSCLKYSMKHQRFAKCCKLLGCLLKSNLELLYVRNNEGLSPSYLLEQLWRLASPKERSKGDAVSSKSDF